MSIFGRIFRPRKGKTVRRETSSDVSAARSGAWSLLVSSPAAMQVATVYRCVTLLSEKIYQLSYTNSFSRKEESIILDSKYSGEVNELLGIISTASSTARRRFPIPHSSRNFAIFLQKTCRIETK